MTTPSLDDLIREADTAADSARRATWVIAQRISPKFRNTDEERLYLRKAIKESKHAIDACEAILRRL